MMFKPSSGLRVAWDAERLSQTRNAYKMLMETTEGKIKLGVIGVLVRIN